MDFEICLEDRYQKTKKSPRLTSKKSLPPPPQFKYTQDSQKRQRDLNGVDAEWGERIQSKKC